MVLEHTNNEYRIDTGRSELGTFVRVVHVPTNTTESIDPIGARTQKDVVSELIQSLTDKVQKMNAPFSLWRLDDNDNEFLILKYWREDEAKSMRKMYEDRGHKQTYFIKKDE